jgi:hypothetical protein
MARLFKKGDFVRNKMDGKVLEVLRYFQNNFIEAKRFDQESREVYFVKVRENFLSKF